MTALLTAAALASGVAGADVRYDAGGFITVTGDIRASDVAAIKSIDDPVLQVLLGSEGGLIDAAIEIGRIVRAKRWSVHVPADWECLSSCALIYIGAVSRSSEGVIGLHRPYLVGHPQSRETIEEIVPAMYSDVRAYVKEMGVTAEFAELMMNTPPETMLVLEGNEIERFVPARDPLDDELRIAHAARVRGISTEEYRRRQVEAEDYCDRLFQPGIEMDALVCRQAIFWGLTIPVYRERAEEVRRECLLSEDDWKQIDGWGERWPEHPLNLEWEQCQLAIMQPYWIDLNTIEPHPRAVIQ